MAMVANRRSVMTLFSRPTCPYSHRVRIVLAEKNINVEIVDIDGPTLPEDLIDLNPYNSVPTLVDRDLVLYDSRVVVEYLDERFPHPPLMPVDPVTRAQFRLALYRIERDWYGLVDDLEGASDKGTKRASKARRFLHDSILASAEVFGAKNYFLSDEFSLVDATIAPILWRLPHYGIELSGAQAKDIDKYGQRVFERPSFQASLTELERELQ
ncbi:MAG: glutathione S-transferase N-terminal domain-containing protein [Gammaproteobacteria bacterium]|nr:glutathione S-transferase N-terminal domain-containing protein [Gammaproteobacteria bacterium]